MAIWQCDFHLVPRSRVQSSTGSLPPGVLQSAFDDGDWWRDVQPPSDFRARLAALLPSKQSWSSSTEVWGAGEGDRVDVYLEGDRVSDILVRVDLRDPSSAFAEGILAFARACDAVLIGEHLDVVEPEPEAMTMALQRSRSARFLRDPESYLRRVALGGHEDA